MYRSDLEKIFILLPSKLIFLVIFFKLDFKNESLSDLKTVLKRIFIAYFKIDKLLRQVITCYDME